ncbi:hypothetical protein QQS21_011674 [Conoideocrella luteorostrata]|uniref:Uncharacterized protein n=1 Tax=Conoideocrella luteorostrata TaxID=1105319 RepID=A0AAJ0CFE7_9HYPO|nr:hypothetical protein QQS21_011674 [Conoideocrella luteorostrata]
MSVAYEQSKVKTWLDQLQSSSQEHDRREAASLNLQSNVTTSGGDHWPLPEHDNKHETGPRRVHKQGPGRFDSSEQCLETNPDAISNKQRRKGSILPLSRKRTRYKLSDKASNERAPISINSIHDENSREYKRKARRKTRHERYDAKANPNSYQECEEKHARLQESHRSRHKRILKSGKEVVKNFTSDSICKEHVTMKPHISESYSFQDSKSNNDRLTDLSFHDFDLGRSGSKTRKALVANDIDNRYRRSNKQQDSNLFALDLGADQRASHAKMSSKGSLIKSAANNVVSSPQEPNVQTLDNHFQSKTASPPKQTFLVETASQESNGSNSFPHQPSLPGPVVAACRTPQVPGLHDSRHTQKRTYDTYSMLQEDSDDCIAEILRTGVYDGTSIPHGRIWAYHSGCLDRLFNRLDTKQSANKSYNDRATYRSSGNFHSRDTSFAPEPLHNLSPCPTPLDQGMVYLDPEVCLKYADSQWNANNYDARDHINVSEAAQVSPLSTLSRYFVGQPPRPPSRNMGPLSREAQHRAPEQIPSLDNIRRVNQVGTTRHALRLNSNHGEFAGDRASQCLNVPKSGPETSHSEPVRFQFEAATQPHDYQCMERHGSVSSQSTTILHHAIQDVNRIDDINPWSVSGEPHGIEHEGLGNLGGSTVEVTPPDAGVTQRQKFRQGGPLRIFPLHESQVPSRVLRKEFVDIDDDDEDERAKPFWKPYYLT